MMEHYVTLFDSLFLPQGLALHISMERHIKDYTLWVLCVDDPVHEVLTKLNLPNVRLLQLSKLETTELLSVKPTRSKGEYCWTLTPFAPRFVFEADSALKRVTYIDADLWFRKNPASIFREFDVSGKHVLITDHAYAPEYDQSATSGQYCVQFMTFTREGGESVRKWWEERCLEWCYARPEDGKYGDQKYLDDWPERFVGLVHVLNDKGLTLAPWNAIRFPYAASIFYHFHGLRLTKNRIVMFKGYVIPRPTYKNIYLPYLRDFRESLSVLCQVGIQRPIQADIKGGSAMILSYLRHLFAKLLNSVTYKTLKIWR
jgi:hypothetical protein